MHWFGILKVTSTWKKHDLMIQTASDMAVFNKRNELCSIQNTLIIDTI